MWTTFKARLVDAARMRSLMISQSESAKVASKSAINRSEGVVGSIT
jgi:hypothetical protein